MEQREWSNHPGNSLLACIQFARFDLLCCRVPGMMSAVQKTLDAGGVHEDSIHAEEFPGF